MSPSPNLTALRYRIRGCLSTTSPLHLGCGEIVHRTGLSTRDAAGSEITIDVQAVATDYRGKPYLPGSALKGVTRSACKALGASDIDLDRLFGSRDFGGGVVFHDAFLELPFAPGEHVPHLCPERLTGVTARTAVDRRRRTPRHQQLFHVEFVPAGARFALEVTTGTLGDAELALLLAGLAQLGNRAATALGAQTGQGWGRARWQREAIEVLVAARVQRWLREGATVVIDRCFEPLAAERLDALETRARELAPPARAELSLGLRVRFEGPFLSSDTDPRRAGPGEGRPDAAPLLDAEGRAYLPASSLRGALRSRAERIVRTLGGAHAACGPGATRPPCAAVESLPEAQQTLCPVCRLLGAPGWASPLEVHDLVASDAAEAGKPFDQHFVAIDRFTGGGAEHLKFQARAVLRPTLSGRLGLDLEALSRVGVGPWALALLALVLRDLAEGDVPLGFGSARGYGVCRASFEDLELPPWEKIPEPFRTDLDPAALPARLPATLERTSPLGQALERWIGELAKVASVQPVAAAPGDIEEKQS